jgi:hypothetical protein
MVFGIIVDELPGDGMATPGKHSAVRRFFDVAFGIGLCRVEVMPCRLGVVRRCLLMIVYCLFIIGCAIVGMDIGVACRCAFFLFLIHVVMGFICLSSLMATLIDRLFFVPFVAQQHPPGFHAVDAGEDDLPGLWVIPVSCFSCFKWQYRRAIMSVKLRTLSG